MSRCVDIIITVALAVLTALAFVSHLVPQVREELVGTARAKHCVFYSKFISVESMEGGDAYSIVDAGTFIKRATDGPIEMKFARLGQAMVAAQFFAALGTVAGFLATMVSLVAAVGSQSRLLRIVRTALTGVAFVSCMIAMAVVAGCFRNILAHAPASIRDKGTQRSVGFGFICVAFCGYLIVFAVDVALMVCECLCRPRVSRNAWNGGAGDDTRTYGSQMHWMKE